VSENLQPPAPVEPPAAVRGAVIRRLQAAEETPQERLIKKHVPAWVISGAIHVGLIALLILLFGTRTASTKPPEKIVSTSVEREDVEAEKDLTNTDIGLQSTVIATLPEQEQLAEQTVDSLRTQDTIGQPNVQDNDTQGLLAIGLPTPDKSMSGAPGTEGSSTLGTGGDNGYANALMLGRAGATKSRLIKEGGGNEASERAVALGLAWLAQQQRQDGSWVFDIGSREEVVAATGMAILPFLAAGETHLKGKKYQKTVDAGLRFLIKQCPTRGTNAGKFTSTSNMYAQAIGTMALCEAYGMTRDKSLLLAPAQAAINYIQQAQGPNGSWGYSAGTAGDTSIVGWQIQALKAAQLSKDIVVDDRVIKKAINFLNSVSSGSRKAAYGYSDKTGAQPGTALTAVGLLCRYYIDGWGPDHPGMAEGVLGLSKNGPKFNTRQVSNLYYYYYATQVVHFFGSDQWRDWNEGPKQPDGTRRNGMRDWLIETQFKGAGANQGSWEPEAGTIGASCGRLGTTALCLLTLEVYYRHLPLYKRSQTNPELR
jgi:hypothetical protein